MIDKFVKQLKIMRKKEEILDKIVPILTISTLWNGNKGLEEKQLLLLFNLVEEYYELSKKEI